MDTVLVFWLNVQDLWGAPRSTPVAACCLLKALVVAQLLGRWRATLSFTPSSCSAGNRPCIGSTICGTTKSSIAWYQLTPSLVIQFGLYLVPDLSKTATLFIGNVALAFTLRS